MKISEEEELRIFKEYEKQQMKEKVWAQYEAGRKIKFNNSNFKDRMKKLQNSIK